MVFSLSWWWKQFKLWRWRANMAKAFDCIDDGKPYEHHSRRANSWFDMNEDTEV